MAATKRKTRKTTKRTKRVGRNEKVLETLNQILEMELAGVVRYTHYSLMIFGYNRIPIVSWLQGVGDEGLRHAHAAGEHITSLGGHPSLRIGALLESHQHDIGDILAESLEHEKTGLQLYYQLLKLVSPRDVHLEEYARGMIAEEEQHVSEIEKMLRQPGELKPARG